MDRGRNDLGSSDVHALYRQYGPEIRGYLIRRLRCAETAADLTQETFLRLLRQGEAARLDSPRSYLYRIAANLLNDHRRRQAARPPLADAAMLDQAASDLPGQDRVLLARSELARLGTAVESLPPRRREVFVLHKYGGLSYGEIADRLGISKNTVMVHMTKALAHCRDRLAAPE